MAPEWVSKNLKLLKYEHIIYHFKAGYLEIPPGLGFEPLIQGTLTAAIRREFFSSSPISFNVKAQFIEKKLV